MKIDIEITKRDFRSGALGFAIAFFIMAIVATVQIETMRSEMEAVKTERDEAVERFEILIDNLNY